MGGDVYRSGQFDDPKHVVSGPGLIRTMYSAVSFSDEPSAMRQRRDDVEPFIWRRCLRDGGAHTLAPALVLIVVEIFDSLPCYFPVSALTHTYFIVV